nr:12042_t:CDS:2 [Entrophospora candida]
MSLVRIFFNKVDELLSQNIWNVYKFVSETSQKEDTEWVVNMDGKKYDIVKMICKSFEKIDVFRLNCDEPILSIHNTNHLNNLSLELMENYEEIFGEGQGEGLFLI